VKPDHSEQEIAGWRVVWNSIYSQYLQPPLSLPVISGILVENLVQYPMTGLLNQWNAFWLLNVMAIVLMVDDQTAEHERPVHSGRSLLD
jgi:hypothetical protein